MIMRPNTQQILAHTHTAQLQQSTDNALISINFVGSDPMLTINIDNQIHKVVKNILKKPQDLFNWGSINTKDNLKGQQPPLYSANQLSLDGHQQTPTVVDLHQYKYWLVVKGEALMTIGERQQHLQAKQAVLLPPMNESQLTNLLATELVMIQMQCRHGFNPNQLVEFKFNE